MDELQQLLTALGVGTTAEALSAINKFNGFLTDARVATASDSLATASSAIQGNANVVRQLEAATGKQGPEALATALAWKQGAEAHAQTKATLEALQQEQATKEATAKLDEAVASGRLAPANREQFENLYTEFGNAALDAALSALPAASAPSNSPVPKQAAANGLSLSAEDKAVAKQMGLTAQQMIEFKQAEAEAAA